MGTSPGIYLREDPIRGTVQLGNVSEPQAVSAEKAAFYLDAALASRATGKYPSSNSSFLKKIDALFDKSKIGMRRIVNV